MQRHFLFSFIRNLFLFYPEKASIRIRDILKKLDIQQRGTEGNPNIQDMDADIDYNAVDNLLYKYRKQDEKYLVAVTDAIKRNC